MYYDNPSPGIGYLILNIAAIIVMVLIPILFRERLAEKPGLTPFIIVICAAGAIVFGIIIHASFNTTYSIEDGSLELKNGILLKGEYEIDDIESVDKTAFNFQTFGSAFNLRGHCNRFTGGVKVSTGNRVIYISPADPDAFIAELRKRKGFPGD